jgi:parallel beta-helix repeat protein
MARLRNGMSEPSLHRAEFTNAPILDRERIPEDADGLVTSPMKRAGPRRGRISPAFAASIIVALMVASTIFVGFSIQTSRVSAYISHSPIRIASDLEFTDLNGVTNGTGFESDPYIIEGWDIDLVYSEGIYISDTTAYFVIRNVYIHGAGFSAGVHFSYVSHGYVMNSTLTGNNVGMRLDTISEITIANNNIDDQVDTGIMIDYSFNVTIANNTMNRDAYGIHAGYDVHDVSIVNNTMDQTDYGGILVDGDALRLAIVGNSIRDSTDGYGIAFLSAATNIYVADNNLSDNDDGGVSVTSAAYTNVIRNNTVLNGSNGYGIYILQGDGNVIENNTFAGNRDDAIYMGTQVSSGLNVIANNTVINNLDIGISCNYGTGYSVVNNLVQGNAGGGISFLGNYATIAGNTITDNPKFGISLGLASGYNDIIGNTFVHDGLFARFLNAEGNDISSNTVNGKPLVFLEDVNGYAVPIAGQVIAKDCSNITVASLDLSRSSVGVELWHSVDCSIQGVLSTGNQYGVYMENWSERNTITLCNLSGNIVGVSISTSSHGVTIQRSTLNNNTGTGVEIGTSDRTTVLGNELSGNGAAVQASQCQRTVVQSNIIKDSSSYGATILYSNNVTILQNNFSNAGLYGVYLYSSSYCTIDGNQVDAITYGIYAAWSSSHNTISNNNVFGNQFGVYLTSFGASYTCDWNLVTGNTVTGNSADGLYLRYAKHNTLSWNNVSGNGRGIHVNSTSATTNWIYLNNFTGNTVNARSDDATHGNWWNTSTAVGYTYGGSNWFGYLGNRYGDYAGVDSNNNGVGETPYALGQEQDIYPLTDTPATIIPEFSGLILPITMIMLVFAALGSAYHRRNKP